MDIDVRDKIMINFLTKEKFSDEVLELVKDKDYEIIDALLETAEKYELGADELKPFISPYVETLLFHECRKKNLISKINTLFG